MIVGRGIDCLIVAAGRSRRMGFDKIQAKLRGKTVLEWSLRAMAGSGEVGRIVVVCPPGREEEISELLQPTGLSFDVVAGGERRKDSVLAGLQKLGTCGESLVAVHDAARPFVRPESVMRCIAEARRVGAAVLAVRVADTLHRADKDGILRDTVSREDVWQAQTPQVARYDWLMQAVAVCDGTDEAGMLGQMGFPVALVENPHPNPKLTYPSDFILAEALASLL